MRDPRLAPAGARVFRILTSSGVRKGSLSQMNMEHLAPQLLSTIDKRVRAGLPIQLTLMAFPFKVPHPAKTGLRTLPDQAELSAIRHLVTLATRIRSVYPAGLEIELIHDGAFIADVFGVALDEVRAYESYFAALTAEAGARGVIRCHDFGTIQQQAFGDEPDIERIEAEGRAWWSGARGTAEWRDCFTKTAGMLNQRLHMSSQAELEARIHNAMIAYRVKDTLIHRFDPRPALFPDAIHATTRVQPNRLALWLVRRGDALLPWHGVGVMDQQDRARVMRAADVTSRTGFSPHYRDGESTPFCHFAR